MSFRDNPRPDSFRASVYVRIYRNGSMISGQRMTCQIHRTSTGPLKIALNLGGIKTWHEVHYTSSKDRRVDVHL